MKLIKRALIVLLCLSVLVVGFAGCKDEATENVDFKVTHIAEITIKHFGTITVALAGEVAPITVENFVSLAESGFYDGVGFHRIIKGFMMQGGDPDGTGFGGSGKNIDGEFALNGHENNILHERGVISMARADNYDSASSQFFIMHQDAPHLNGSYAAFGKVIDGMDTVDKICAEASPIDSNGMIAEASRPIIETIKITKK